MNKSDGMSHITLIFCIALIIAIIVICLNFLKNETKDRQLENLVTDMLLIQGKVKVLSQENIMNKDENPLKGIKISENLEDDKVKIMIDKGIINLEDENIDYFYILDDEFFEEVNLPNVIKGFYIVNYKTYEVYSSEGLELEKETYYSLSSLKQYSDKKEKNKDKRKEDKQINSNEMQNEILDQDNLE